MLRRIYEIRQFSPCTRHHWANILIVGFLEMRARMQSRLIAQIIGERRKTRGLHMNRLAQKESARESGIRCSCLSGCKLGLQRHLRVFTELSDENAEIRAFVSIIGTT